MINHKEKDIFDEVLRVTECNLRNAEAKIKTEMLSKILFDDSIETDEDARQFVADLIGRILHDMNDEIHDIWAKGEK